MEALKRLPGRGDNRLRIAAADARRDKYLEILPALADRFTICVEEGGS
jgi:hypothetical protein